MNSRRHYWVGKGRSSRWQDTGNWSSEPGGRPGHPAPRHGQIAVLDGNSHSGAADLYSCPAEVQISGFKGRVRLPGEMFWQDFSDAPSWRHPVVRLVSLLASVLSSPRVSRVVGDNWRRKVQTGTAVLCASAGYKAAMVMPRALGGVNTRFFVAAGNWNNTATWSATSGGAPGASFPVAGDIVNIDAASPAGTLTVNVASACDTLTINKSTATVLHNAGTTLTGALTLTTGTLNTNGQTCSWGSFSSSNTNTRTLTPGASVIALTSTGTAWATSTTTGLTVTANTAVVTLSGAAATFSAGSNLNGLSVVMSGSGTCAVSGGATITLANFTRTGTAVKTDALSFGSATALTCTGICTLGGNSTQGVNRLLVQSNTAGSSRTITAAAYVITGDVDYADMSLAYSGAASWTNTGSAFIGDAGGNSGAVTTNANASVAQSQSIAASFTWSTAAWTTRVPLPQDDVTITGNGSTRTITQDMPRAARSIDTSAVTGTPTFTANAVAWSWYGNLNITGLGTFTNSPVVATSAGRSAYTITSGGVTFGNSLTINAPTGTYTLADAATWAAARTLTVTAGTFASNGKNVSTGTVVGSAAGTINFGSGGVWSLNLTGTVTPWNAGSCTLTNVAGSTISYDATDSGVTKTFAGNGKTYGTLRYTATGSGALTITGNNTGSLDLECTTARTVTFAAGGTWTVPSGGTLTLYGASGATLSLVSSAPGTHTRIAGTLVVALANAFVSFSSDVECLPCELTAPVAA